MLGLGWTEMLVIGVVALIVIGPKDLPMVMKKVGQFVAQIRRMGSDFQREISKTTGLDEVRNLRESITAPLKQTTDEIRREFNSMTATGVKPSGVIKPADPKAQSVVDEIRAKAGLKPEAAALTTDVSSETATVAPDVAGSGHVPPAPVLTVGNGPVKKAVVRAKAAPTRPVIATQLPEISAADAEQVPAPLSEPTAAMVTKRKPAVKKVLIEQPAIAAAPAKTTKKAAAAAGAPAKPIRKRVAKMTPPDADVSIPMVEPTSSAAPAADSAGKAGDA